MFIICQHFHRKELYCIEDCVHLQKYLTSFPEWSIKWGMRFNPQKCYYIMSSPGGYKPSHFYQINDEVLQQVQSTPYLGIELSEDTTFERHIARTVRKASKMLGFVKAQSHIPSRTSSVQKMKNFGQCVVIRWACGSIR